MMIWPKFLLILIPFSSFVLSQPTGSQSTPLTSEVTDTPHSLTDFLSKRGPKSTNYVCLTYCNKQLSVNRNHYLTLGSWVTMELYLIIDKTDAISFQYRVDSPGVKVEMKVTNPSNPGYEPTIDIPDSNILSWEVEISKDTVDGYEKDQILRVRITNSAGTPINAMIYMNYNFPLILVIALVVGGVIVLILLGIGYLRRRARLRRFVTIQPRRQYVQAHGSSPAQMGQPIDSRWHHLQPQNASPLHIGQPPNRRDRGKLSAANFEERFPEYKFEEINEKFLMQTTCSICLEELQAGMICRQLYCRHVFHTECVKLWILNQISKKKNVCCPNCNKDVSRIPKVKKEKKKKGQTDENK